MWWTESTRVEGFKLSEEQHKRLSELTEEMRLILGAEAAGGKYDITNMRKTDFTLKFFNCPNPSPTYRTI